MKNINGYKLLSDFKFQSNYSKFNEKLGRRETWSESVDRVFKEMHEIKFGEILKNNEKFKEYYDFAINKYKEKKVLGSQRALQFGGLPILKHNAKIFNCTSSYCDRIRFFQEAMYMLLCGCGVGFSVQNKHIEKLSTIKKRSNRSKVFLIDDSIEGWSDAIGVLLSSYFDGDVPFPKYQNCHISFDYSQIRTKGSYINGGFKAPGHEGLRNSIQKIEELLERELDLPNFNGKIKSIVAYDIVMHMSDAVLSGGVRRSATIALFSPNDELMLRAKTGNWFVDNPQRARSNNTVLLNKSTLTKEEFHKFFEFVKEFGEPGFGFTTDEDIVFNPCFEIGMYPQTKDGETGWSCCVSYDTKLLTKTGVEIIGKVVDENREVEIWNGSDWSKVKPFQTGNNDNLYRVNFSDGSYLDCTSHHKFLVKNRFQKDFFEKDTLDLITLLNNSKYSLQIPRSNINVFDNEVYCEYAYGFVLGECEGLPDEIFSWDRKSTINFIAGWIDSDGSKVGNGVRIHGKESKIRDLQLLLTKLGIDSSVNLMAKKGVVNNDVWYVQISNTKDLYSNRIELKSIETKYKGNYQIIKSIVPLDGNHNSYCLNEPKYHNCLFNNVLTKQCNLTEINGNSCVSEEEFYENCKAASIIGTIQASYTDFKYLRPESKEICDKEALLGVSITGFMNNPKILLNPEIQRKGARIVKEINKEVSQMIGINQAARTTCVKPSGNASTILGTASGIHGEHHQRYFRNVQVNKGDDIGKFLKDINSNMFEDSVWSANNTDWVVSFPIETNNNSIFKDELIGVKLLEYVKLTQQNWIEEGTNIELCVNKNVRHNVSNTIIVDDWDVVEKYLYENRNWFSGVSLLTLTGDKDYNQAPFTSILTAKELVKKYGDAAMFASGLIVDGLNAFNNNLWSACDTLNGLGEKLEYSENEINEILKSLTSKEAWKNLGFKNGTLDILSKTMIKPETEEYKRYLDLNLVGTIHNYALKKDWVRRAKQFAKRYFTSIKEMTYCLKDVHNYHKWIEINRDLKEVDWKQLNIKPKYVDIDTTGAVACSGNSCEIVF